jgi:hypothetical protein
MKTGAEPFYNFRIHFKEIDKEFTVNPADTNICAINSLLDCGADYWLCEYRNLKGQINLAFSNNKGIKWNTIANSPLLGWTAAHYKNDILYAAKYNYSNKETNLYLSFDKGVTAVLNQFPTNIPQIYSITSADSGRAWCAGENGAIYHTKDMGGIRIASIVKQKEYTVKLSPQPADQYISIEYKSQIGNIKIYNQHGQIQYQNMIADNKFLLDCSAWTMGICILHSDLHAEQNTIFTVLH